MIATVHRLFGDEEGATMIEYALVLLLVSTVAVGVIGTIGVGVVGFFTTVAGDF